jgi:hypothetical protein
LMYDHSLLVLSLSHITSVMYFLPAFLISINDEHKHHRTRSLQTVKEPETA